jgi:hypothetical protein
MQTGGHEKCKNNNLLLYVGPSHHGMARRQVEDE